MSDKELRRIADQRGFELVRKDRIKTISVHVDVKHEAELRGDMGDHLDTYIIEDIGHGIAVKLAEFKKLLITKRPAGEMMTVYSAELDVIVPPPLAVGKKAE